MDTKSSNRTNAIRTVITFCSIAANVTITNAITAFAGILATVVNKLALIDAYDTIVTSTTTGVTLDTKSIRKTMESIAFKCNRAVIAFASQSPVNNTLIATVNYSKSKLKDAKKEDIGPICEKIRQAADDNMAGASAYGITDSDTSDLTAAISLYYASSADPRNALINKDDAIKQIKKLIKEVNQNLFKNQMDNMVSTLEASQSEFVGKYFKAREIIDLGITHTKIKGTTKNEALLPLALVLISLKLTGTTQVLYKIISTNNGTFKGSLIKPGNYDIVAELVGFQTITNINVHFAPGKAVVFNFIMKPVV